MIKRRVCRYLFNLLLAVDQFAGALCGIDCDETISSYLGKTQRRYGGSIPWRRPLAATISRFLDWLDPQHCKKSIEEDEGGGAAWR